MLVKIRPIEIGIQFWLFFLKIWNALLYCETIGNCHETKRAIHWLKVCFSCLQIEMIAVNEFAWISSVLFAIKKIILKMDLNITYINFGARYWKISIRWISIFDKLEKFPGILFQPSHLQMKNETQKTATSISIFLCYTPQLIKCQSQLQSNSIRFHFYNQNNLWLKMELNSAAASIVFHVRFAEKFRLTHIHLTN